MDGRDGEADDRSAEAVTPEQLADLQAGLLDDVTAARLRHRARAEPAVAHALGALDDVRRDLAHLGRDEDSAPEVPAPVTARIGAALHNAAPHRVVPTGDPGTTHTDRQRLRGLRLGGAVIGGCAAVAALIVGAVTLAGAPGSSPPPQVSAKRITVSAAPHQFPLTNPQLVELLDRDPNYGPLADPQQRAACLGGLGAPTAVLGGRPIDFRGRPAVLMLLPGETPAVVRALVVAADCGHAATEPLAETVMPRRP